MKFANINGFPFTTSSSAAKNPFLHFLEFGIKDVFDNNDNDAETGARS